MPLRAAKLSITLTAFQPIFHFGHPRQPFRAQSYPPESHLHQPLSFWRLAMKVDVATLGAAATVVSLLERRVRCLPAGSPKGPS
jgi:hypothetical protein